MDSSPPSSPARKRQRLSSPTYEGQLSDFSQDDIDAFDQVDATLSQSSLVLSQGTGDRKLQVVTDVFKGKHEPQTHYKDDFHDADNPFVSKFTDSSSIRPVPHAHPTSLSATMGFTSAHSLISVAAKTSASNGSGFASASKLEISNIQGSYDHQRSPSPELVPEQDYSSWFEPVPVLPALGFQTPAFPSALSSSTSIPAAAAAAGFMKASHKGWIAPSETALERAKEKIQQIWQESEIDSPIQTDNENIFPRPMPAISCAKRQVLHSVENSTSPITPKSAPSAGFARPSIDIGLPNFTTPSGPPKGKVKAKPFKSPLLSLSLSKASHSALTTTPGFTSSPLNPSRPFPQKTIGVGFHHPLASSPLIKATPITSFSSATPTKISPLRVLQITPNNRNTAAKFTTPFKPGMKPGEAGRKALGTATREKDVMLSNPRPHMNNWLTRERSPPPLGGGLNKSKSRFKVFNLSKPLSRQTLTSSGFIPQTYSSEELQAMEINVTELSQISPSLAMYYSFHTPSTLPLEAGPLAQNILGPSAALDYLLDQGCWLATKPWVDNHWCLILWKLAGMVALDPEREGDPKQKRWCWAEVIRQLFYRYERELNEGSRPPLRLIATQDAPASSPMVLCVSNVTWSEGGVTDDGLPIEPHPELEVTDGWYRLRAQVDQPLARAIRRGIIRIGRKIAVAGARLISERKEPMEVLEAYNSVKLRFSGNSSHMASWSAKLGFQLSPYVSTLNSLSPDGGVVAVMDLIVVKIYSIAFIEFIEDKDGKKHRVGPRNEAEEATVNEAWKRRQEIHVSKLRSEFDKKTARYEGYLDRLERRASPQFCPGEEDLPPDHIEQLYDELEDPADAAAILSRVDPNDAGWLARCIRESIEKERENAGEEIEQSLKEICPPRDVRSFRVIVVEDACTRRRPANRKAQLTVWDILSLSLSEGSSAGHFEVGHRFLVTNLLPTQPSAWMGFEAGSEVYLSTRRDTKWTRVQAR